MVYLQVGYLLHKCHFCVTIFLGFCSKQQPFEDIQAALNLWLRPDCCLVDNQCDIALENMPILLYHVIDILSMKVIPVRLSCLQILHGIIQIK